MLRMIFVTILTLLSATLIHAEETVMTTFTYHSDSARAVFVAGSFNNWDATAHPLVKNGGQWQAVVPISPPGFYYYKFVVDGKWVPDPSHSWRINDGGDGNNSIIKVGDPQTPQRRQKKSPLPTDLLPRPVLEENPEWTDLYYAAWNMAWPKIASGTEENGFVKLYMDEGFNELIYQWDTCFMTALGVYGRDVFPAMPSLDNFYRKQREDGYIQRVYWETTGLIAHPPSAAEPMINPPLFAWMEYRYYQLTGDDSRVDRVLQVLTHYYAWIDDHCRTDAGQGLYYYTPLGSGMDNTPRDGVGQAGWIDLSAQQALAALMISRLAIVSGNRETARSFAEKHWTLKTLINDLCWDDTKKFYFDLRSDGQLSSTKHIGAFWTLLAEVCPTDRVQPMLDHLQQPTEFWRPHLVPTLSADDPHYDPKGHYWLGSVWAPTNYMVVSGLKTYDQYDLAREIALNHLQNMAVIYTDFVPSEQGVAFEERFDDGYHTIWECYAPEQPAPATRWDNTFYSRQDFVGWSGLGPIAMLIEDVLGFTLSGWNNTIEWRLQRTDRHGLENIRLGDQLISLIAEPKGDELTIKVNCEEPFQLDVLWQGNWYRRPITKQTQEIHLRVAESEVN